MAKPQNSRIIQHGPQSLGAVRNQDGSFTPVIYVKQIDSQGHQLSFSGEFISANPVQQNAHILQGGSQDIGAYRTSDGSNCPIIYTLALDAANNPITFENVGTEEEPIWVMPGTSSGDEEPVVETVIGFDVERNSNQNITSGQITLISWNHILHNDTLFDNSAPTLITITEAGYYQMFSFATISNGTFIFIAAVINGVYSSGIYSSGTFLNISAIGSASASNNEFISALAYLNVGDKIGIVASSNSNANITTCRFCMKKL